MLLERTNPFKRPPSQDLSSVWRQLSFHTITKTHCGFIVHVYKVDFPNVNEKSLPDSYVSPIYFLTLI